MDTKERIDFLRKEIEDHNYSYYILDKPLISDFEFDQLMSELISLEDQYPQFSSEHSPSNKVGGGVVDSFRSVKHEYPMLSLSNTYNFQDLQDFDTRIKKLIDVPFEYVCELKFDGVSISLIYEQGKLKQAITRGDGTQGDDGTLNIKTIRNIPLRLRGEYPERFEIRGEVFLSLEDFDFCSLCFCAAFFPMPCFGIVAIISSNENSRFFFSVLLFLDIKCHKTQTLIFAFLRIRFFIF